MGEVGGAVPIPLLCLGHTTYSIISFTVLIDKQ